MFETIQQILHDAPSQAWFTLAGGIVGAIASASGALITNGFNSHQQKVRFAHEEKMRTQELTRDRLEELYILVGRWAHVSASHHLHLALVMKGQTDYNQYLDTIIAAASDDKTDFNRLEMIVRIYGGDIASAFDDALTKRDTISQIHNTHKAAYKSGEPGDRFLAPATQAQLAFDKACKTLQKAIAEACRA
ncbi:hypothetical protein [Paraburkholderia lycopersici]|uniref:Uncharacterized protein n=1 Tax=Paraburkholderia lycopersici TaxID=416944 RepID=A0A1G6UGN8_9BURK|nr:hypothetical protein [Paraburkholderia lycopersici]SDD40431.1 hypothetical protein SAMN05421548_1192 [Paraburkholderia lycopersici]